MIGFLKLIKWPYLLGYILVLFLIKYLFFLPASMSEGLALTLNNFSFFIFVLAQCCLLAAGFVIRAIFNKERNALLQPNKQMINKYISEKTAYNYFFILNILGVGLGFFLTNNINQPKLFALFFIISALQYLQANALKQIPFLGNLILALIYGFFVFSIGIMELIPSAQPQNFPKQLFYLDLLKDYSLLIMLIFLGVDMLEDLIYYKADKQLGLQTLAVTIGLEKASKITAIVCLLPIIATVYYIITYLFSQIILMAILLLFLVAPLLYLSINLFLNQEKETTLEKLHKIFISIKIVGVLILPKFNFLI